MAKASAVPAEASGSENSFYPNAKTGIAVELKRVLPARLR
jgi:hypothetical protein